MMKKKNSSFELKRHRKGQKMILSERYGDLYERAGDRCHIYLTDALYGCEKVKKMF